MATVYLHINGVDYELAVEVNGPQDGALQDVQDKLAQLRKPLPRGVQVFNVKRDGGSVPLFVDGQNPQTSALWVKEAGQVTAP